MTRVEALARPFDRLKRWWFGSSVRLQNIDQCPRCRGTDQAHETYEGFGIALFQCERCSLEWWS